MVGQCMNICLSGIGAVFGFLEQIFDSLDGWSYVIGAFMIYTVFRVLLVPVIGGAISSGTSDMAMKLKQNYKDGKNPQAVTGLEKSKKG